MISPEENLKTIIEEIKENKIMLPDFQRKFEWSIDKQCGLVASVLTQLPVGSILLLEAPSQDYKSKRIGLDSKEDVKGPLPEKTSFLLDGQQRMTCLTNVFSDIIHESSEKKVSKLSSRQLLANRFYLTIKKWDEELISGNKKDLFGMGTLDFRFDVSKKEEPDFLTADIIDQIECRPFLGSDYGKKPYMPGQKYTDKLDDYCFEDSDVYLIPLYLLIGSNSRDDQLRRKRLLAIIDRMKDCIAESICTHYRNLADAERDEFASRILIDASDYEEYMDSKNKEDTFESKVDEKADLWKDYFQKYLYSCIEQLRLSKIEMPEGSRARAIDIYENMNMGGLSLSTFDLVAARVAKVSKDSLYDRVLNKLTGNTAYNNNAIPNEIKKFIPKDYNASTCTRAVVEKSVTKECSNLFLEVLGLYCNNLNYETDKIKGTYSKSAEILKLTELEIDKNCDKVCIAIDRALCFLQTRCGVKLLSDVNYKIMIRFIAYIFTNDKWYKDAKIHDKLEAWYWAAVFSGEYDKDQTERFEVNLKSFIDSIKVKAKTDDWLVSLKDNVLETSYFSDCSFLLMEKANEDRVPKDHLAKYFCQFYLSRPYSDLITDSRVVNVFTDESLERHHIIPLGSVTKIGESTEQLRKDKTHILNSPLNFVLITTKTNGDISDDSLSQYENDITAQAKTSLFINSYPSVADLDDSTKIQQWMKDRHKTIKGAIQNRIAGLL